MDILYKYRNSGFFMAAISLLLKGQHICGLLMVLAGIVLFKIDLGECKNNACFTFKIISYLFFYKEFVDYYYIKI